MKRTVPFLSVCFIANYFAGKGISELGLPQSSRLVLVLPTHSSHSPMKQKAHIAVSLILLVAETGAIKISRSFRLNQ